MSRDIVADIVRNALAPEPEPQDGRPRETPLEERLRLLHNALGGTKQRVGEQQAKLDKLRAELDEYRALMERVKEKAVALERAAAALPVPPPPPPPACEPAPAGLSAGCTRVQSVDKVDAVAHSAISSAAPAPLPSIPLDGAAGSVPFTPRPLEDAVVPRLSWRQFVPYAAIVMFGVAMSVLVTRRPAAPAQPSLKTASVPAPSLLQEPPAPAASPAEKPAVAEEESNAEILNLVSSFVPPGAKRSVAEILGPELDDPSTESPWSIMRVDEHTALVSLRPYGEVLDGAPVYEFTVDPAAKTVTAGPETLANLRGAPAPRRTAAR